MKDNNKLEHAINWKRAIFIDEVIDDGFVRRLAPTILRLREESNDPITVGIDSPGGSLDSLDVLLGLLRGPTQNVKKTQIITVATNRAYSAAANLLSFGDYSVALKHSQVLYHDVRFHSIPDVTPEKALRVAKSLQETNDSFALRLAKKIILRLIWIYIDLQPTFEESNKKFSKTHKKYEAIVGAFAPKIDGQHSVDIASFATSLFAKLSRDNDALVSNVMQSLGRWITLTTLASKAPTYRPKNSRIGGLLDGSRHLHKLLNGSPENFQASEQNLKLLITLMVSELADARSATQSFEEILERATRDFILFQSMSDKKHLTSAVGLMLQNELVFFGKKISEDLKDKNEDEQAEILSTAMPHAQLFWHFCLMLCRELFQGEHILKPSDAQLLGLVDEVAGGGPIESRREFDIRHDDEDAK